MFSLSVCFILCCSVTEVKLDTDTDVCNRAGVVAISWLQGGHLKKGVHLYCGLPHPSCSEVLATPWNDPANPHQLELARSTGTRESRVTSLRGAQLEDSSTSLCCQQAEAKLRRGVNKFLQTHLPWLLLEFAFRSAEKCHQLSRDNGRGMLGRAAFKGQLPASGRASSPSPQSDKRSSAAGNGFPGHIALPTSHFGVTCNSQHHTNCQDGQLNGEVRG